jgi:phosphoserine phosphatase
MEEVLNNRLQLNPGAEKLVKACQAAGMKVLSVSWAALRFSPTTCVTGLAFNWTRSNVLEVVNGELTGRTAERKTGAIFATAKKSARCYCKTCALMGIEPAQSIAMGDGANDLPMMGCGGLVGGLSRQAKSA